MRGPRLGLNGIGDIGTVVAFAGTCEWCKRADGRGRVRRRVRSGKRDGTGLSADLCSNAATDWTMLPSNWVELQIQWEYSHATAAVLNLIAVKALTRAVLHTTLFTPYRTG